MGVLPADSQIGVPSFFNAETSMVEDSLLLAFFLASNMSSVSVSGVDKISPNILPFNSANV